MSSSGCINLELKPEAVSAFFNCGAPVIVALEFGESEAVILAAAGNVGFVGPACDVDEVEVDEAASDD